MGLFQPVDGEVAIIVENGVFKQVPLFMRNGYLFGKLGGGFVRLNADGSTSKATARLETITYETALSVDPLGRLCDAALVQNAKPLPEAKQQLLLGVSQS